MTTPKDLEAERIAQETAAGGDLVLDDVHAELCRYVVFPSPAAADAVTLFAAATHLQQVWEHATRLVIKSPQKRCGKSRLEELLAELSNRSLRAANISAAALVRSIDDDDPPTILIDEADTVFATRRGERSEGAEDLRGILNAGHARGGLYIRCNPRTNKNEQWPTFAMAVIAGSGNLPDTIEDRAVIISMRRRGQGETVTPFRRRYVPALHALRERLHAWARAQHPGEPQLPVEDRAADVWEPLIAIADCAGGTWPGRARAACIALANLEDAEATLGEQLLTDLHAIWEPTELALATTELLRRLKELDESPWGAWRERGLNANDLSRFLRPYGVRSKNVANLGTDGPRQLKGYERADLVEPWERYLRAGAYQASQPSHEPESPGHAGDGSGEASRLTAVSLFDDDALRRVRDGPGETSRLSADQGEHPSETAETAETAETTTHWNERVPCR